MPFLDHLEELRWRILWSLAALLVGTSLWLAGADPGPICYGRGIQATVSDANLMLGRLHPQHFLGGGVPLDGDRTRTYMEAQRGAIAESLERFGWVKPLIYNGATSRLVDGHARLELARAQGLAAILRSE